MFGARISAGRCVASITLAMVKVLPEPVTPSSTWSRSLRVDAGDQFGDRRRLVALGREVAHDAEADAALGLFRPRRPVRHPGLVAEFGTAFAQQLLQRLHRGADPERHRLRRRPVAFLAPRLGNVGDFVALGRRLLGLLAGQRFARIAAVAQRLAQLAVDVERRRWRRRRAGQRPARHIAALRRLVEALHHRFPRGVLAAPVGAPLERIVGRRLQAGARTHAGGALLDTRIEQPLQRRIGRRRVRPVRLGAGGARRVLLAVLARIARQAGGFHRANMGGFARRGKGGPTRAWEPLGQAAA